MAKEPAQDERLGDRISTLNMVFENLIADASDLAKGLYWGDEDLYSLRPNLVARPSDRAENRV
jgi:hypothetical protein